MSDRDDEENVEELPEVAEGDLDETQPHVEEGEAHTDAPPPHVEEEEELPPEKPWQGTFQMLLPGMAGAQAVKATDSALPTWLRYVLADDGFFFKYHVFPKKKAPAAHQPADGEDAPPPPPPEDEGAAEEEAGFKPNEKIFVRQARDNTFYLTVEEEVHHVVPVAVTPSTAAANTTTGDDEKSDAAENNDSGNGSPASAAIPVVQQQQQQQQLLSFTVDPLTLAAVKSLDCLIAMLEVPHVALETLFAWALADARQTEVVLHNFVEAKNATAHLAKRKIAANFSPFFVQLAEDESRSKVIQSTVRSLCLAGVAPSSPLDTESLVVTVDTALLYLNILKTMPRSVLVSWTLPQVNEGDDPIDDDTKKAKPVSFLLGSVILDHRRRVAREAKGKKKLRDSAATTCSKFFPKKYKVEQDDDAVVTNGYSAKKDGTIPLALTLYQSDLLLLVLGSSHEEDLQGLFDTVLTLRLNHAKRSLHDDRMGMIHLLFNAMDHLRHNAVHSLLSKVPFGKLFVKGGLARVDDFIQRFLLEHDSRATQSKGVNEDAVARNQWFLSHFAHAVAAKFWPELSAVESTIMALERHGGKFLAVLMDAAGTHKKFVEDVTSAKPLDDSVMAAKINAIAAVPLKIHPRTVFNSSLMALAIEANNLTVVKYLALEHNVVTAKADPLVGGEVEVLDEALARADIPLLQLLIDIGFNLNTKLHQGRASGVSALQDLSVIPRSEVAEEVLSHWRKVEADRIANPDKKHGLLLSIRSA